MKNFFLALLAAGILTVGCGGGSKEPKAEAGDAQAVTDSSGAAVAVDTQASVIEWTGYKPTGKHFGTLKLKSGELKMNGNNLSGGSFVFDMASIAVKDLDEKSGKADLEKHLKDADFFDVTKHPEGKFVITKVTEAKTDSTTHLIEGNLTLRGNEKSLSFPAKIIPGAGKKMQASAAFKIDRTEFGIVYHSKKDEGFMKEFNLGKMKDKLINNDIDLKLNIVTAE